MRTIRFLLEKEFRQIFRNSSILRIILIMPIIQLIILPLAADYEVKNVNLCVVDHDHSTYSRKLVSSITASGYFRLQDYVSSYKEAFELMENDKADLILEIPPSFEQDLVREQEQSLLISVNAINGTKANLGAAYLSNIIFRFNGDIRTEWMEPVKTNPVPAFEIRSSNWYNPLMNYRMFMVPGILATLVTMVGSFLSALNIVREKEIGTMEQINVTPIRKHQFIIGKLLPFWILGNVVFTIGLLIAYFIYRIEPVGSLFVIYGFLWVYLVAVLSLGLFVSTFCETQQQAMFIMFFFMMVFILMGGLFTSIDSMPLWAQVVTWFNPVSYLIEVMRMVILKGSGFRDILPQFLVIVSFAIILTGMAVLNYRKTS